MRLRHSPDDRHVLVHVVELWSAIRGGQRFSKLGVTPGCEGKDPGSNPVVARLMSPLGPSARVLTVIPTGTRSVPAL